MIKHKSLNVFEFERYKISCYSTSFDLQKWQCHVVEPIIAAAWAIMKNLSVWCESAKTKEAKHSMALRMT